MTASEELKHMLSEWRATLRGPDGRRLVIVRAHTIREAQRDARLALRPMERVVGVELA